MVHTCIVVGCTNKSNDPQCFYLSWHRLSKQIEELRCVLPLPDNLEQDSSSFKHHRICSECMRKVPKACKPPQRREIVTKSRPSQKTQDELRATVAHDHCSSLPTSSVDASYLHVSLISTSSQHVLLPRPQATCA